MTWVSIEELTLDYYKFLEIPNQTISLYVYINPIQAQRVWGGASRRLTLSRFYETQREFNIAICTVPRNGEKQ